jgi:hypothetical protein
MALILLRIQCTSIAPGEFVERRFFYNTETRMTEETPPVSAIACSAYERALDELIHTYCQGGQPSDTYQTQYRVFYAGEGLVRTETTPNSTSCPVRPPATCDLGEPLIVAMPPSWSGATNGRIEITASSSKPPLKYLLFGTTNTTGVDTGIFTGLPEGVYAGLVSDAATCQQPFGPISLLFGGLLLKSQSQPVYNDPGDPTRITGYARTFSVYDTATRTAIRDLVESGELYPDFSRPTDQQIDAYYLADNITYRQVFHDGNFDLAFRDTVVPPGGPGGTGQPGQLRIVNVIKTDIDTAGSASGAVLLEATNDGVGGPLTYLFPALSQSNSTGAFANLAAGTHRFRVSDTSGQSAEVDVTITDAYRPRWRLTTQDVTRQALEVVILERGYTGAEDPVCATGSSPLVRRWEGAGNEPLAEIPEIVGSSATVQLLAPDPRPFAVLATGDDRRHRLDVYRSGVLEGRFYVTPDLMRVQVHEALPTISITATDGLGGLRDTLFENHLGERVTYGRWPVLHTILHALSRTDTNLPLYVNVQLRDVLMSNATEPLAATAHDRAAYGEEEDTPLLHDVLTALLRPYNACLWQARGAWWIASPLDMALAADADAALLWTGYNPAGQRLLSGPAAGRGLELWAVKNPGELTQARHLEWEAPGAEQATTAAAKVVQATVKLQLRESSLSGGELQDWNAAGTLPAFWGEGPALRVVGEKAGTYALRLPPAGKVLSAPMQTYPTPDYSPIVLRLKARCTAPKPADGQPANPAVLVVTVLTEGVPDPQMLRFEVPRGGVEAKMQEYSATLPAARTGLNIRLRLENTSTAPVEIGYVRAQILPALIEWPPADTITVTQPDGVLLLPKVELVHADQPRLALSPDTLAPAQRMDVLAWKHAFTLLDGRATSLWHRPGVRRPAPLLETAALDALEQRTGEQRTLAGTLLGYAGTGAFSFGQLVVSPDARGKLLWVVSCEVDDLDGSTAVVLRPIGEAPDALLPLNARVTTARAVRVTTDGAIRVYRP